MAIAGQLLAPTFPQQGIDLINSFFIYAVLAQFTHLGAVHLGLNLAGLALVTWGFSTHRSNLEWLWIQLASLVWVALYVAAIEPLAWYCGLSGALHFQFAACLLLAFFRSPAQFNRVWPLWALAGGLLIKLLLEWHSGHHTDALVGGPIAYEAHRGGALGGMVLAIFVLSVRRGPLA